MNHLRSLAVVLAAAALALSLGTGAFSASVSERGVQISVVDDSNAVVGYETSKSKLKVENGDTEDILTITNRLTRTITVTDVSASTPGSLDVTVDKTDYPTITSGKSETIRATFRCDQNGIITERTTVDVTVESTSGSALVSIDGDLDERQFHVECGSPEDSNDGEEAE